MSFAPVVSLNALVNSRAARRYTPTERQAVLAEKSLCLCMSCCNADKTGRRHALRVAHLADLSDSVDKLDRLL